MFTEASIWVPVGVLLALVLFVLRHEVMNRIAYVAGAVLGAMGNLVPRPSPDVIAPDETYDMDADEEATIVDMPLTSLDHSGSVRVVVRGFGEGETDLYKALSSG